MFTSFLGHGGGAMMVLCGSQLCWQCLRGTGCNCLQAESGLVYYNIRLYREWWKMVLAKAHCRMER